MSCYQLLFAVYPCLYWQRSLKYSRVWRVYVTLNLKMWLRLDHEKRVWSCHLTVAWVTSLSQYILQFENLSKSVVHNAFTHVAFTQRRFKLAGVCHLTKKHLWGFMTFKETEQPKIIHLFFDWEKLWWYISSWMLCYPCCSFLTKHRAGSRFKGLTLQTPAAQEVAVGRAGVPREAAGAVQRAQEQEDGALMVTYEVRFTCRRKRRHCSECVCVCECIFFCLCVCGHLQRWFWDTRVGQLHHWHKNQCDHELLWVQMLQVENTQC